MHLGVGGKVDLTIAQSMYKGHPLEVQVYIGIFTWLVCVIDDIASDKRPELEQFQQRFYANEQQPTALLQALADSFRETYLYYDNIVANFIIVSSLSFVTASVLEVRPEFTQLTPTKGGKNWPYYVRDKGGLPEAYGYMIWPKALYPDITQFLVSNFGSVTVLLFSSSNVSNQIRLDQKLTSFV